MVKVQKVIKSVEGKGALAEFVAVQNLAISMEEALRKANLVLSEVYADYSHPSFTDRHNTAPRINIALNAVREVLN